MSALKDQDPDYGPSLATNEKHQRIYEENARNSTARKITAIVEKEFSEEIANKEREILEIQERLHKTLKTLHLLRYVVVADFYGRKQCSQNIPVGETKQTHIHPAIKELIGKSPKVYDASSLASTSTEISLPSFLESIPVSYVPIEGKSEESSYAVDTREPSEKRKNEGQVSRPKKIPRYIPPKMPGMSESPDPSRNARQKVRKRIIVGNISKWIPPDWREDAASHKWTMYVRGDKGNPDIDDFVAKVRFFLHPSYRPNDVVEVTSTPFCLSRRGWGEFPVRVQLHFKNTFDKPMDIIHHLKLDRTYTGLQTLGSETLVNIWIFGDSKQSNKSSSSVKEEHSVPDIQLERKPSKETVIKTELIDTTLSLKKEPPLDDVDSNLNSPNEPAYSIRTAEPHDQEILLQSDATENDKVMVIRRLRFCVQLDHNYIGAKCASNSKENNLTIKHSLSPQSSTGVKVEDLNEEADSNVPKVERTEETDCEFVSCADSKGQSRKARKADFVSSRNNSLFIKDERNENENEWRNSDRIILGPSSKVQESGMQPLQIFIPPSFETIGSKRVLVVQNDKTIPVDISSCNPSNRLNGGLVAGSRVKVKLNLSSSSSSSQQGRGLSLLKKRPCLEENGSKTVGAPTKINGNASPAVMPNFTIKPSAMLLLNVNSNVPTLKIVEPKPACANGTEASLSSRINTKSEEHLDPIMKNKVTLGKDKHKIQSRKEIYEKALRSIETARISDTVGLLRFIMRRLPILSVEAADPEYRRLHPYACKSEEEFFQHNAAKRKALEWNRASVVRQYLLEKGVSEEELWSVKEIMVWAQLHGYTPLRSPFSTGASSLCNGPNQSTKSTAATKSCHSELHTITEPLAFHKWLRSSPDTSRNCLLPDIWKGHNDEDEIIEIEREDPVLVPKTERLTTTRDNLANIGNNPSPSPSSSSSSSSREVVNILELDTNLVPLYQFVAESAREIGVNLESEEIVPSVSHCAAGRVIIRALECLVEELARGALANACQRDTDNGLPKVIALDDVRRAILNRNEFDLLTNQGLGSNYRPSLMD